MEGHTMVFNCFDVIWFYDFSWLVLNSDLSSIKVCYYEIDSAKSIMKCNLLLKEKISTFSLEGFMLLFNHLDDYIARFNSRIFISFSVKYVLFSVRSTFIDSNF